MSNQPGLKILYKPVILVHLYLLMLMILYTLGPFKWKTENPFLFYTYIIIAEILFQIGYAKTIKKLYGKYIRFKKTTNNCHNSLIISQEAILRYLSIFIFVNLILTCMYLLRNTELDSFSITKIFLNIKRGIVESDKQYIAKFSSVIKFGGQYLAPIMTLMSPFTWPVIPLSIFYFKKFSLLNKILIILTIFFETARWISTGTNKGVIDLILIFSTIILVKQWQKSFKNKIDYNKMNKNKNLISFLVLILFLMFGFIFFGNNISSRVNDSYEIMSIITGDTKIDLNSPLMKITPRELQPLLVYTTSYLTQGYYGLSLALTEPFYPMFGVGNSYFLIENIQAFFNVDLWQYTYQARIAYKNWDPFVNWHSLYVWLANDLSFWGVLLLMYFWGKYLAILIFKSVVYEDPIGISLLILMFIAIFYIPANNQILSSPFTFMAFWGLNILWIVKKCIVTT